MRLERTILILGWAGVAMILVDLHVYSPFPGKILTHVGAIVAGICFVLGGIRVLLKKKIKTP